MIAVVVVVGAEGGDSSLESNAPEEPILHFVYQPGAGVGVNVDGKTKGTIAGDDFARALFSI